jgi:hypothetical protein
LDVDKGNVLSRNVVAATHSPVCTSVCTSNQKNDLDALVAELLALPKKERARLFAMLLGKGEV